MGKATNIIGPEDCIGEFNNNIAKSQEIWDNIANEADCGFDGEFLRTEYQEVILYNDLKDLTSYFHQPRVGRNKPITNVQKRIIWQLASLYREQARQSHYIDRDDLYNKLFEYYTLRPDQKPFAHVIVDEVQDLSNPELRFIRSIVPEGRNDLFLVGDPFQRIYNTKINFSKVGINIRGVRSRCLKVNYRTTEEIRRSAVKIIKGIDFDDFDGGKEKMSGYVSLMHGKKPTYVVYPSKEEEMKAISSIIDSCITNGFEYKDIIVATYMKKSLGFIRTLLHERNIRYTEIGKNHGDSDGIVLSTFHNMKGLESKVVILADVSKDTYPWHPGNWMSYSASEKRAFDKEQKALLYMAQTRAIQLVYITGRGEKADI